MKKNQLKKINISELQQDDFIVNLGEVLEIEELPNTFTVVISRMSEKQVFTFKKDEILLIT